MNTELLLKVRDAILAEPLKFDMTSWFDLDEESPCGTVACIAGHAIAISHKWKKLKTGLRYTLYPPDEAQVLLDISDTQRYNLFVYREWPNQFVVRFLASTTPLQRAKVAAARINYMIKTGK